MKAKCGGRVAAHGRIGWVCSLALAAPSVMAVTPQISSFSPASGPIGTTVVVKGTALSSPTAVTVDGTAAKFVANSATQVTVTVPATGSGPIAITTSGGTGSSATPFTMTPSSTLSGTIGHPGAAVTVTGAGFGPYTSVDVYFDVTDTALAVSNGLGVVSITIDVPTSSQPGTHWITLDERANHYAAQESFFVNTNWPEQGFSPSGTAVNPYENILTTSNVSGLDEAWSEFYYVYGNPAPIVEYNDDVFVADISGAIHAYSSTGYLLWHATEKQTGFLYAAPSPVASGGYVYLAADGGDSVYAFKAACRTDGGICAPTWVTNIGTMVQASPTLFQGTLEVPGADGQIHPLNATTGVAGTPFYAAYANTLGSITTPVAFSAAGSYFYGIGEHVGFSYVGGGTGSYTYGGTVSPMAVSDGRPYFTTSDGYLHQFSGWNVATPGPGCTTAAPAVAGNLVFAGDCSSISAYEASTGTLQWSVTTGDVAGLSVADGVLYACTSTGLAAYNPYYGGLLWTGGLCSSAPVIVNGTLYGSDGILTAYNLPQLRTAAVPVAPEPSSLKPNLKLPAQRTRD